MEGTDYSQRSLAAALGTDGSLVGKWINGKVRSVKSIAHRRKLPQLLDTPPDYFSDPPDSDRLAELLEQAATIEEVGALLLPLREAIFLLARGDRDGALRVLSEGEAQ